jgi:hypothetical protein
MSNPSSKNDPRLWVWVSACFAAIVVFLALTYGVVFRPGGDDVSTPALFMLGGTVLVAFGGIFGVRLASRVLDRLPWSGGNRGSSASGAPTDVSVRRTSRKTRRATRKVVERHGHGEEMTSKSQRR